MKARLSTASALLSLLLVPVLWAASPPRVGAAEKAPAVEQRGQLVTAYHRDGEHSVKRLTQALDDERIVVRRTAVHLLAKIGAPAETGLAKALEHPDPRMRRVAIKALASTGNLTGHWAAIIMDDHPANRRMVRFVILKKHDLPEGQAFDRFFEDLTRQYENASAEKRKNVVETFASVKPLTPQIKRIIANATKDPAEDVRHAAYEAIERRPGAGWQQLGGMLTRVDDVSGSSPTIEQARLNARVALKVGQAGGKYDQALSLARKIADRPYAVFVQMRIMFGAKRYAALAEAFADEQIANWPYREAPPHPRFKERDLRAYALYDRGRALREVGDAQAAEHDLARATDFVSGNEMETQIWYSLARLRQRRLDDDRGALDAYSHIARMQDPEPRRTYYRAVAAAARLLRDRGRHVQAIDMVRRLNPAEANGRSRATAFLAQARTYAAAGRTDEAMAAYRGALGFDTIFSQNRAEALLYLGQAHAEAGEFNKARDAYRKVVNDEEAPDADRKTARQRLDQRTETQQ